MSFFEDFKKFAFKGNVIDLAVGVVIGAAFQKIVTGIVANVIMPLVGLALPPGNWRDASIVLREDPDPAKILKLTYGELIGATLDFLIVAFALFIFVGRIIPFLTHKKKEEEEAAEKAAKEKADAEAAKLTKDQELLAEIRDLLKTQKA